MLRLLNNYTKTFNYENTKLWGVIKGIPLAMASTKNNNYNVFLHSDLLLNEEVAQEHFQDPRKSSQIATLCNYCKIKDAFGDKILIPSLSDRDDENIALITVFGNGSFKEMGLYGCEVLFKGEPQKTDNTVAQHFMVRFSRTEKGFLFVTFKNPSLFTSSQDMTTIFYWDKIMQMSTEDFTSKCLRSKAPGYIKKRNIA